MIPRAVVICLGMSQLVGWGVSFYLAGTFGQAIQADTGWSAETVYGGLSAAIVVMGLFSPLAGRAVDRHGGRRTMTVGACLNAAGCLGLALSAQPAAYYAAWLVMGLGMRLSLYDAAFATLARIGGPAARRAVSQITLFGGLASTVFWPVGHALESWLGWRGAVVAYAGFALATIPLFLTLPRGRYTAPDPAGAAADARPAAIPGSRETRIAGALYAVVTMLVSFLAAGNASHLIGILEGLGLTAAAAVSVAAVWGLGQVSARLGEVAFGSRLHPTALNLVASAILPSCFAIGLAAVWNPAAAVAYAFLYGTSNGLLTITRGSLPLVLFDPRSYGAVVGALLVPSFLLTAFAPVSYAYVLERHGSMAVLGGSALLGAIVLAASLAIRARYGGERRSPV